MTDNPPVCTGSPYESHSRTEMYETETLDALQHEHWRSYHCPTCRTEIHLPSHE